jgi:hypothetical protein
VTQRADRLKVAMIVPRDLKRLEICKSLKSRPVRNARVPNLKRQDSVRLVVRQPLTRTVTHYDVRVVRHKWLTLELSGCRRRRTILAQTDIGSPLERIVSLRSAYGPQ